MKLSPMIAVAAGALVVGLAAPAAASEASHLITGSQIKNHTITGKKLKNNTLTGKQIKESTLGIVPKAKTLPALKWHTITTFENSWIAYPGGVERAPAWAIDAQGIVHLRGAIEGGSSGTAAFTLPASISSGPHEIFVPVVSDSNTYIGALEINNGSVYPTNGGGAPSSAITDFASLEGVTFSSDG